MTCLLLVDDEKRVRDGIKLSLSGEPYDIIEAETLDAAYQLIQSGQPDVMLLDVHFRGGMTCIPLLERMRREGIQLPTLILSGAASAKEATDAMKLGAYDFMEKPISAERLLLSLRNALDAATLKARVQAVHVDRNVRMDIIGQSAGIERVKELVALFGRRDAKVLITGETGTGKELVAYGIWRASARSDRPFVVVNSAAIPDSLIESELFGHRKGAFTGATADQLGKIEMADGGTLFLDEIGELSLAAQSKLLRFLESGEIQVLGSNKTKRCDVRLIAATSRDLAAEIKAGRFREDLYFRLNVGRIEIPALRERREDIVSIFEHFVASVCRKYGEPARPIDDGAKAALMKYAWPGNVRELRNIAERAVLMSAGGISKKLVLELLGDKAAVASPVASAVDGPATLDDALPLKDFRRRAEAAYIAQVLKLADGSVTKAAQILELDRSHLHQKLRDLGIS